MPRYLILVLLAWGPASFAVEPGVRISFSPAEGLGAEDGTMRRDPSDLIKVGETYYVWYTKGKQNDGYDATVWYAVSSDGHRWAEKGESVARGHKGSWDEQSVYTPNILVRGGKFWLFYTGVPKPFFKKVTKTAIGIAVSDSPNGPWRKLESNPILRPSDDSNEFDSMRVDDACLLVRQGRCWLYYKGRQRDNTAANTKMGVAISKQPDGPYVKYSGNPVIPGGHEVLVWPQGRGVMALLNIGPPGIRRTLQYAEDGLAFRKGGDLKEIPRAAAAYRPEAFTDSGRGKMIQWGIHIGIQKGYMPFLERFDCSQHREPITTTAPSSRTAEP